MGLNILVLSFVDLEIEVFTEIELRYAKSWGILKCDVVIISQVHYPGLLRNAE